MSWHCQLVLLTVSYFLAERKIPVLLRHIERTTNTHKTVTTLTCHELRSSPSLPYLPPQSGSTWGTDGLIGGRLWNGHCVMLTLLFFSPWYDSGARRRRLPSQYITTPYRILLPRLAVYRVHARKRVSRNATNQVQTYTHARMHTRACACAVTFRSRQRLRPGMSAMDCGLVRRRRRIGFLESRWNGRSVLWAAGDCI